MSDKRPEEVQARMAAHATASKELRRMFGRLDGLEALLEGHEPGVVKLVLADALNAMSDVLRNVLKCAEHLDMGLAKAIVNGAGSSHLRVGIAVQRAGLAEDAELLRASGELLKLHDEMTKYAVNWDADGPWN